MPSWEPKTWKFKVLCTYKKLQKLRWKTLFRDSKYIKTPDEWGKAGLWTKALCKDIRNSWRANLLASFTIWMMWWPYVFAVCAVGSAESLGSKDLCLPVHPIRQNNVKCRHLDIKDATIFPFMFQETSIQDSLVFFTCWEHLGTSFLFTDIFYPCNTSYKWKKNNCWKYVYLLSFLL